MMMADCEANYARLCRIMPSVLHRDSANDNSHDSTLSTTQDTVVLDIDLAANKPAKLTLSISERCRFTTMVNLQVIIDSFTDVKGEAGCVNMSVRLYHDVNMAEVIACNHKPNRLASYEYPNELMFQPDEKAQQNRFLSEWLGLCLKHGMSRDCNPASLYQSISSDLPAKTANANAENAKTKNRASQASNQQPVSTKIDTLLVASRTLGT